MIDEVAPETDRGARPATHDECEASPSDAETAALLRAFAHALSNTSDGNDRQHTLQQVHMVHRLTWLIMHSSRRISSRQAGQTGNPPAK